MHIITSLSLVFLNTMFDFLQDSGLQQFPDLIILRAHLIRSVQCSTQFVVFHPLKKEKRKKKKKTCSVQCTTQYSSEFTLKNKNKKIYILVSMFLKNFVLFF